MGLNGLKEESDMRDHRKLEAFQIADSLAMQIYSITRAFPADEKFGLIAQLRRAAVSIGANIVEGAARESKSEYVRFLGIAYASARELEYELSIAARLGYIAAAAAEDLEALSSRTCRVLHGLIQALRHR
jgi:four helix bundle protein